MLVKQACGYIFTTESAFAPEDPNNRWSVNLPHVGVRSNSLQGTLTGLIDFLLFHKDDISICSHVEKYFSEIQRSTWKPVHIWVCCCTVSVLFDSVTTSAASLHLFQTQWTELSPVWVTPFTQCQDPPTSISLLKISVVKQKIMTHVLSRVTIK